VQLDKALCSGLVEGIAGVVGSQIEGVQRLARAAAGARRGAGGAAAVAANKDISEQETEELRTALGAGGTGKSAAGALRGSAGALKDLADAQKRRETRMMRDSIDLSLTDLATFYRDALMQATGASVEVVHVDAQRATAAMARAFSPEALLRCIDVVMATRAEISQNVKPEVAVGGMVARISLALVAR